ncbi:MAG: hypothetical protein Fur0019_03800 [Tibeticola sp.]
MSAQPPLVLDTNIALDLLLFADPAAQPLARALASGAHRWLATEAMREEFRRVLDYPQIAARCAYYGFEAAQLLARFDAHSRRVGAAPRAPVVCRDADDQKFIDLAVVHRAVLLSKDRAVLATRQRLAAHGVVVARDYTSGFPEAAASTTPTPTPAAGGPA